MGTLTDYFTSDCTDFNVRHQLSLFAPNGASLGHTITLRLHLLAEAHSKYLSVYSGPDVAFEALLKHLEHPQLRSCDVLGLLGQSAEADMTIGVRQGQPVSVKDLVFSARLLLYVDQPLSDGQRARLVAHAEAQGFVPEVRDVSYARYRSANDRRLAFIAHAKSDGRGFASELANALSRGGCPVWFDEYSLRVGDSLLDKITEGLQSTAKCVLILSPDFLSNEGWCKYEFKTAKVREIIEGQSVILPVWHGVSKEQVYQYLPSLVDKVGISTAEHSVDEVARQISDVLMDPS